MIKILIKIILYIKYLYLYFTFNLSNILQRLFLILLLFLIAVLIANSFIYTIAFNDSAEVWQLGFQDCASPGFSKIIEFHDTIFYYLIIILVGVFWILFVIIYNFANKQNIVHKFWTHGTLKCPHFYLNKNKIIKRYYSSTPNSYSTINSLDIKLTKIDLENCINSNKKIDNNNNININYNIENTYNDLISQKLQILKENKNKSGVYKFTNLINDHFYVGSSVNLSKRFSNYFNVSYISKVKNELTISRALIKYGYSKFKLEILEYCNKENLLNREQYYLDLLKPVYNIEKIAGSSIGVKRSEENKLKISKSLKIWYNKHNSSLIGR